MKVNYYLITIYWYIIYDIIIVLHFIHELVARTSRATPSYDRTLNCVVLSAEVNSVNLFYGITQKRHLQPDCGVSEPYPYPTPRMVIGNSQGEGVSIANFFKGKNEARLEIPRGWEGLNQKNHPWGSYGYFL